MASQSGGVYGPFQDRATRTTYRYDSETDDLVFENGNRQKRPDQLPRSALMRGPVVDTPAFEYVGSPSSRPAYALQNDEDTIEQDFADLNLEERTTEQASAAPPDYHPAPEEVQTTIREVGESTFVRLQDRRNLVSTLYKTGPQITDPELEEDLGVEAHKLLLNTVAEGEVEKLFESFRVRQQPRNFFTVGKVFLVLWVEPAGEKKPDRGGTETLVTGLTELPGTFPGRYGERVFSKIRRFVVIKENQNFCSALPIATYGKQGVGKRGVKKSDHAIIYSGKIPPQPMPSEEPERGEEGMRNQPIRVDPDDKAEKLDPMSRIDFQKVHTIQHNIKVRSYGRVNEKSMSALRHQFRDVWLSTPPSSGRSSPRTQRPRRTTQGTQRESADTRAGPSDTSQHIHRRRESALSGNRSQAARSVAGTDRPRNSRYKVTSPTAEGGESEDEYVGTDVVEDGGQEDPHVASSGSTRMHSDRVRAESSTGLSPVMLAKIPQVMAHYGCSRDEAIDKIKQTLARGGSR